MLVEPPSARFLYVFAHGAGAGMRHEFMVAMASELAVVNVATIRWEFPYMVAGKNAPDRPAVAEAAVREVWQAAHKKFSARYPMFGGGKSFGGRMTSRSHAAAPLPDLRGIAFLGFPLYGAGKPPSTERAEHLASTTSPLLFIQGTRDDLADLETLRPVVASLGQRAELHVIDGADHGFEVRVKDRRAQSVHTEIANALVTWMERIAPSSRR